jgi:uncharacterized membrane protein
MISKILILILVTLIPALELRASIPLGMLSGEIEIFNLTLNGLGLNWILVFFVCVITNIILGFLVYILLDKFVNYFLKFPLFAKYYHRKVEKTQRKIKPSVEKYGWIGIALFIAIPFPGSGSYTGALAAYLLGLDYRKFIIANTLGVVMAGILVTLAILGGQGIFSLLF